MCVLSPCFVVHRHVRVYPSEGLSGAAAAAAVRCQGCCAPCFNIGCAVLAALCFSSTVACVGACGTGAGYRIGLGMDLVYRTVAHLCQVGMASSTRQAQGLAIGLMGYGTWFVAHLGQVGMVGSTRQTQGEAALWLRLRASVPRACCTLCFACLPAVTLAAGDTTGMPVGALSAEAHVAVQIALVWKSGSGFFTL